MCADNSIRDVNITAYEMMVHNSASNFINIVYSC